MLVTFRSVRVKGALKMFTLIFKFSLKKVRTNSIFCTSCTIWVLSYAQASKLMSKL